VAALSEEVALEWELRGKADILTIEKLDS